MTREEINGNIQRIDFVYDDGNITTDVTKGYATCIQILNSDGKVEIEYYLDEDSNPTKRIERYYSLPKTYVDGLCVSMFI